MKSILVEAWDAFKVSTDNNIRYKFAKTMLLPLSPPKLTTNFQECDASIQVSSGAKAEEINNISQQKFETIKLKVTRNDYTMVVLIDKGTQQPSRKIILQAVSHDAVRKQTVIPIQETKKECITVLHQNNLRLVNDKTSMRNLDLSS